MFYVPPLVSSIIFHVSSTCFELFLPFFSIFVSNAITIFRPIGFPSVRFFKFDFSTNLLVDRSHINNYLQLLAPDALSLYLICKYLNMSIFSHELHQRADVRQPRVNTYPPDASGAPGVRFVEPLKVFHRVYKLGQRRPELPPFRVLKPGRRSVGVPVRVHRSCRSHVPAQATRLSIISFTSL